MAKLQSALLQNELVLEFPRGFYANLVKKTQNNTLNAFDDNWTKIGKRWHDL